MKILQFPKPGDADDRQAFAARLDAALYDVSGGSEAEDWRELCADVHALAPPISPQFERELYARIYGTSDDRPSKRIEQQAALGSRQARRRLATRGGWLAAARTWLGSGLGPRLIALGGVCTLAVIVGVAIAGPWRVSTSGSSSSAKSGQIQDAATSRTPSESREFFKALPKATATAATGGPSSSAAASSQTVKVEPTKVSTSALAPAAAPAGEAASARVQERAASITLAPKPQAVQAVADQVAQLASRDGGFVQSSQVHEQRGQGGEADIDLSLPSARLSAALAELARLAPTRAQSQSLQDITDVYGAARAKLSDAVAERRALLRALARASTQGQIESLRARISLVGGSIVKDRAALAAVSQRGSNSAVEVTVLGDARAGGERSTLKKGLHDAGDVLEVALAVLIVALAVLVPLALLAALGALAWRVSRRRLRERALS